MTIRLWFSQSFWLIPFVLASCGTSGRTLSDLTSGTPAASATPGAAAPQRRLGAIGVQLYTLRAAMEQDFEGTLRDVALLGYAEVELAAVEGVEPYDLLLDQLDRSLVRMELDLFWLAKAGREPGALFDRFPGGFPLAHVKDMRRSDQAMVDVGEGDLDFAAVFAQAERSGMQHFIVEHDNPADPMQSVENSLGYLRQLSF